MTQATLYSSKGVAGTKNVLVEISASECKKILTADAGTEIAVKAIAKDNYPGSGTQISIKKNYEQLFGDGVDLHNVEVISIAGSKSQVSDHESLFPQGTEIEIKGLLN